MTPSWYDVLGVDPDASTEEVRAAWRAAIADLDPADRRFRSLNQAAEVLLDPERRAAYDATLEPDAGPDAGPTPTRPPAPTPAPTPVPTDAPPRRSPPVVPRRPARRAAPGSSRAGRWWWRGCSRWRWRR